MVLHACNPDTGVELGVYETDGQISVMTQLRYSVMKYAVSKDKQAPSPQTEEKDISHAGSGTCSELEHIRRTRASAQV